MAMPGRTAAVTKKKKGLVKVELTLSGKRGAKAIGSKNKDKQRALRFGLADK